MSKTLITNETKSQNKQVKTNNILLTFLVASSLLTSCAQINSAPEFLVVEPLDIAKNQSAHQSVSIAGNLLKKLSFDAYITSPYATLSIMANNKIIVDNLNLPSKGKHTINIIVEFEELGNTTLSFLSRSSATTISNLTLTDVDDLTPVTFNNISTDIGLNTETTYKYGGPSIGDYDNDGDYDFVLNNHNHVPTQLVTQGDNHQVNIQRLFSHSLDFHGSAFGDYDLDGDLDLMVARGGANGTNPTSYILLKNEQGKYVELPSEQTGIKVPARGRSPRWIDLDLDGDLDLMLVNAKTPNSNGPIQLFYKNLGNDRFEQVRVAGIEEASAERTLVMDFNNDNIDDVLLFSPISLWQGNGDFTFTNNTHLLPDNVKNNRTITAAANIDINNDGRIDLYLANGKNHYNISRKSIDYNPMTKRLDIRDDGETGTTAIKFTAANSITLQDMDLTYRQYNGNFRIYLGKDKKYKVVNAEGFQPHQRPLEMREAPHELTIKPNDAQGWPETRQENGLYIGHLGDGHWQAEWVRDQNIYWTVTFSLTGLDSIEHNWAANNRNVQDVLLLNTPTSFTDVTDEWNIPKGGNSWGVTVGDFNNDSWQDLFVFRYGYLKQRVADLLLLNTGKGEFAATTMHNAFTPDDTGHGDMGQAFDFNRDGLVDLLSGSEEKGKWYLYQNQTGNGGNYLVFNVGYSPVHGVDAYSAVVTLTTASGKKYKKQVGSAGAAFSQSYLNKVHFGLGDETAISRLDVRWRNGETKSLSNLAVNTHYE
ncbi:MAG: CRTAC1 family protein [Gammaproteobacteria bacterium]|nr:CRTAC1 family protein [Gammaproteobacteria bacterium]